MNKNIFKYLIIFIVAAGVACSSVMAADLTQHDFDGKFKATVPSNVEFDAEIMDDVDGTSIFYDPINELFIIYSEESAINDETINAFYDGFTEDGTFKKVNTEGNLTIFDVNDDNMGKYAAGVNTDGEVVIVCGQK